LDDDPAGTISAAAGTPSLSAALPYDRWHRYALLQRWEVFGSWPENHHVSSAWRWDSLLSGQSETKVLVKYALDFNAFEIPDMLPIDYQIRYPDALNNDQMKLGRKTLCEAGKPVDFEVKFQETKKNQEFDIGIMILSPSILSPELLDQKYSDVVTRMITFIRVQLNAILASRSAIHTFEFHQDLTYTCKGSFRVAGFERVEVVVDDLIAASRAFEIFEHNASAVVLNRFAAAGRRIFSSYMEDDEIDAFSDLWEAAEFLVKSPKETNIGEGVVNRIVDKLHAITSVNRNKLKKQIGLLYQARCNIVHNAIRVQELEKHSNAMQSITDALLLQAAGRDGFTNRLKLLFKDWQVI
jgi:hypothetical protein